MRFGSEAAGFSIGYRGESRCVCVRAWGAWDTATAVYFARAVVDESRPVVRPFRLLMDVADLRPPDADGQLSFRTIMVSLKLMGLGEAAVVFGDNAIIKMQLVRLGRQNNIDNWTYFSSEGPALERLTPVGDIHA